MIGSFLFVALLAGQSVPAQAACAPTPTLTPEPGFADPRRIFGPDSPGMRATRAAFEIAYRRACRDGLFLRRSLIVGASRRDILYLRNSPDANVASIFSFSVRGARGHDGTGIEYPFVTADGVLHVPTADELHEAIFCRVVGATAREQEEEGRCLPD